MAASRCHMRELTVTANLPRFSHTLTSGVQLLAKGQSVCGDKIRKGLVRTGCMTLRPHTSSDRLASPGVTSALSHLFLLSCISAPVPGHSSPRAQAALLSFWLTLVNTRISKASPVKQ